MDTNNGFSNQEQINDKTDNSQLMPKQEITTNKFRDVIWGILTFSICLLFAIWIYLKGSEIGAVWGCIVLMIASIIIINQLKKYPVKRKKSNYWLALFSTAIGLIFLISGFFNSHYIDYNKHPLNSFYFKENSYTMLREFSSERNQFEKDFLNAVNSGDVILLWGQKGEFDFSGAPLIFNSNCFLFDAIINFSSEEAPQSQNEYYKGVEDRFILARNQGNLLENAKCERVNIPFYEDSTAYSKAIKAEYTDISRGYTSRVFLFYSDVQKRVFVYIFSSDQDNIALYGKQWDSYINSLKIPKDLTFLH